MLRRTVHQASVLDAAEQRRPDTSQVSLLKPSLTRAAKCSTAKPCNVCKSDQNFLRQRRPPDEPTGPNTDSGGRVVCWLRGYECWLSRSGKTCRSWRFKSR